MLEETESNFNGAMTGFLQKTNKKINSRHDEHEQNIYKSATHTEHDIVLRVFKVNIDKKHIYSLYPYICFKQPLFPISRQIHVAIC